MLCDSQIAPPTRAEKKSGDKNAKWAGDPNSNRFTIHIKVDNLWTVKFSFRAGVLVS